VLADGDLWIRRAVRDLYELPAMPRPAQVAEIAEPWRPYRTLACVYLWRLLEVSPVA
jgi:DNA-3-methyladenine glycosylase II